MGQHHSRSAEPQTDWYALILGLLLPFGVGVVISNDSKATLYAAWTCIALGLAWTAYRAWKKSKWSPWIKTVLACIVILAFSFAALYNIREKLRPSFTLITPGLLLNGDTWDFIVNHSGPKSSFGVEILFVDNDKLNSLRRTPKELTLADINSYQLLIQIPEVNPGGYGSVLARQFQWKPSQLDNSHFSAEVAWRDGAVHEDLGLTRVENNWKYAISVSDRKTGKNLFRCKDEGYPSAGSLPPCFPEITRPLD